MYTHLCGDRMIRVKRRRLIMQLARIWYNERMECTACTIRFFALGAQRRYSRHSHDRVHDYEKLTSSEAGKQKGMSVCWSECSAALCALSICKRALGNKYLTIKIQWPFQ